MKEVNYTQIWNEILKSFTYSNFSRDLFNVIEQDSGSHIQVDILTPHKGCYVPERGEIPIITSSKKITVSPYKISQRVNFSDEAVEDNQTSKIAKATLDAINGLYMQEDYDVVRALLFGAGHSIHWSESFSGEFPQPLLNDYIISAIKILEERFLKPTHILVSPDIAEELRKREELKKELKAYAIEVIVTPHLPNLTALVVSAKKVGILIVREDKSYLEYKRPQSGLQGAIAYERVVPVVINSDAVVRLSHESATPQFM